jgi:sortase A
MKKLIIAIISICLITAMSIPAFAANDYNFSSGDDTLGAFGGSTSYDEPVSPDPESTNVRRNKDTALLPPPYGVFSGNIPTDYSNPYVDHTVDSGFVSAGQDLPPVGNEDYAPGSGDVSVGLLPSTSQTETLNTTPLYYADGSIGTLYIERTGKTIKVYEGENLENLKLGAGHFTMTSAWDGNVVLCGHNRGSAPYFSFVKDLQNGDKVTYTTLYGTRTYAVVLNETISETDYSKLGWSEDNILTLITCVIDTPELRWAATLREIK